MVNAAVQAMAQVHSTHDLWTCTIVCLKSPSVRECMKKKHMCKKQIGKARRGAMQAASQPARSLPARSQPASQPEGQGQGQGQASKQASMLHHLIANPAGGQVHMQTLSCHQAHNKS